MSNEKITLKDYSRKSWAATEYTLAEIQLGAILRIADAAEAMSKNYNDLQQKYNTLKDSYDFRGRMIDELKNQLSVIKGVNTKLKNKLSRQKAAENMIPDYIAKNLDVIIKAAAEKALKDTGVMLNSRELDILLNKIVHYAGTSIKNVKAKYKI